MRLNIGQNSDKAELFLHLLQPCLIVPPAKPFNRVMSGVKWVFMIMSFEIHQIRTRRNETIDTLQSHRDSKDGN